MRNVAIPLALLLAACADAPEGAPERGGKPSVHVVNYPLFYFAERIGGDLVEVVFPAPVDGDPAFWKPDDATVEAYQRADVILRNGAGYAKWCEHVSLSGARVVDTSKGLADRLIAIEDVTTHAHGPAGEHEHGGIAFTTWLDLTLAIEQARAIRDAFTARWPEHGEAFAAGFLALERDLRAVDTAMAAAVPAGPLVGSHPVYQYWARRYGANLRSVHWEPDEVPAESGWAELRTLLGEHRAEVMIWEGEPLPETVARLKELGLESIVVDPCGNRPETGDFLDVMRANIARLSK
jgi:zinc transport system substrate-binding protein